MQKISPFLWFNKEAEEAANFYVSTFKNSKIGHISRYDEAAAKAGGQPAGTVLTVSFELDGTDFTALNGGPMFKFTPAISFSVVCEDQAEIDHYWNALTAVPEAEQCGWLIDKYGVSWQIIPKNLPELISSPAGMKAMLSMKKFDIAALEAANRVN